MVMWMVGDSMDKRKLKCFKSKEQIVLAQTDLNNREIISHN